MDFKPNKKLGFGLMRMPQTDPAHASAVDVEQGKKMVDIFMERGFTDLMFSFGCTGGQHRSVYSAQHLAERLNSKFGVEVRIFHREQNISQVLEARPVN